MDRIHSAGGTAGIHVCASTDWGMLLESRIDILNFDAFEYFSTLSLYPEQLAQMLKGHIDTLVGKGIDRNTLLTQIMITPSCGVGTLATDTAKKVYSLTQELSVKYQQAF